MRVVRKRKEGKIMWNYLRNFGTIVGLLFMCSCITTSGVGGDTISGKGWHHPNKTKDEQQEEYLGCRYGCEKSVRDKDHTGDEAVFFQNDCEEECMHGKGYEWH